MVEKFENMNMRDVILENWKNKISYPFNHKDLEELEKIIDYYEGENKELRKQLEEINNFINKANFANIEQLMLDYCAKTEEQKMFIDWLENEIENCKYGEENYADGDDMTYHNENELRKEILSKYKEIIGDKE